MNSVEAKNLYHSYGENRCRQNSLSEISFAVSLGEFLAILGCNGCGKSTLVKHLNALISLQTGELTVASLDVKSKKNIWGLRRKCGMVFQNPDNQFVSSVIEEDIAFGLKNYDTPAAEIPEKIREALALVNMSGCEKKSPHMLSGGEKQRIALAGVLAMSPDILVFDESTSMLDPQGRFEVLSAIKKLHVETDKTIIMITHYIEEALSADRVFLMAKGKILAAGTPREILTDSKLLAEAAILPPIAVEIYHDLKKAGIVLPSCPLCNEELVEMLCRLK